MRALYPGSFDPVTEGHCDILSRASALFDEVVVCVMVNPRKTGRYSLAERLTRLRAAADGLENVTVDSYAGGLLVDYCRQAGIDLVVRGVRNATDMGYELPMIRMNNRMTGIETLLLPTAPSRSYVSSSGVVREAPEVAHGGDCGGAFHG